MTDQQTSSTELDVLLDEYKQPQAKPSAEINELVGFVREQKHTQEAKVVTDAIADAVVSIKGDDALKDITGDDIQDFLEGEGRRDSSINDAFTNRAANPSGWERALTTVQERLIEKNRPPDTTADDVAAATAAVRGTSTTPPEDTGQYRNSKKEVADITGMSDTELAAYKVKVLAENSG